MWTHRENHNKEYIDEDLLTDHVDIFINISNFYDEMYPQMNYIFLICFIHFYSSIRIIFAWMSTPCYLPIQLHREADVKKIIYMKSEWGNIKLSNSQPINNFNR